MSVWFFFFYNGSTKIWNKTSFFFFLAGGGEGIGRNLFKWKGWRFFPNTLSGHHCKSSPRDTGLWTGVFFLSKFGSPSLLVEPLSLSNEAPSSHLRSRKRKTDSRSRNSSESLSKGRRRTGMQLGHTSGIKVSHSLVKTLQDATNSSLSTHKNLM